MKRSVAIVLLGCALVLINTRHYTDVPDQYSPHLVEGVVFIVPSIDRCYGLELEHDTNVVSPFGGECE